MKKLSFLFILFFAAFFCDKAQLSAQAWDFEGESWKEIERIVPLGDSDELKASLDGGAYFTGYARNEDGTQEAYTVLAIPHSDYQERFDRKLENEQYEEILNNFTGYLIVYEKDRMAFQFGAYLKNGEWFSNVQKTDESDSGRSNNSNYRLLMCNELLIQVTNYIDWYQNGEYLGEQIVSVNYEYYVNCWQSGSPFGDPEGGGHDASTRIKKKKEDKLKKWLSEQGLDVDDETFEELLDCVEVLSASYETPPIGGIAGGLVGAIAEVFVDEECVDSIMECINNQQVKGYVWGRFQTLSSGGAFGFLYSTERVDACHIESQNTFPLRLSCGSYLFDCYWIEQCNITGLSYNHNERVHVSFLEDCDNC